MLNRFKRKRYAKTHNLLTGETTASKEEQEVRKLSSANIEISIPPKFYNL